LPGDRLNIDSADPALPGPGWSAAQAVLCVLVALALTGLPFLRVAPNRLVSGEAVYLISALRGGWWMLAVPCMALLVLSFSKARRVVLWLTVVSAASLGPGLAALAAAQASFVTQTGMPLARTSLGSGFWLACVLLGLVMADALQRLQAGRAARIACWAAVVFLFSILLASGWCDDLSIMKEYANRSDVFAQVIARHLQIVALALALTLLLGLPLGWAAWRFAPVGKALFPVLNIIQTIPSIALFGMLMAPLAWLATTWPAGGRAGISGVGLVPGVIALVLYSLLPVVRGTLAGLAQVPSSVAQAANGLGLTRAQVFWRVNVPLALPVVLGGMRTATIQAIGLAAVTALIGAGGLGSIMFEGLFSSAQDLVLLGVLPIIALGVLADGLFKGLIRFSSPHGLGLAGK
jgi:osmoprotectant transport system permease protein